jgi:hypothetical protein
MACDGQPVTIPRRQSLAGFALESGCREGVALRSLVPGTKVNVQTRNSCYQLTVLNGRRDDVLVRGGALFPDAVPAQVQGASAGGSLVKTGWIGVGLRIELRVGARRVVTSPVHSLSLEVTPASAYRFEDYA